MEENEADDEEEFEKDFFQYVEIDMNLLTSVELSDAEILEQYSSSQVSSELVIEDEEWDLPSTTVDVHVALYTLWRILKSMCEELEMFSKYYYFVRNIECLIAVYKQTRIDQFFKKQVSNM